MKITFVYPSFERHGQAHPELLKYVACNEYIGPPSLGIASVAAATPEGHEIEFWDDRVQPFSADHQADLFALSYFTPAATRAMEIGDELKKRGKKVVMGGIFPSMMPELAAPHCDAVVVGEGEPVWPQVVADAAAGQLKPRYQASAPADLSTLKPPRVDLYLNAEREGYRPDDYPLQVSRGCPLACDACVLPIYLGKKSRFFSDSNLTATMKAFAERGKLVSLTEDTSFFPGARKSFRAFLELVLALQREGVKVKLSYIGISMPMILNLDATLLAQLKATGIDRFYLVGGFDPITRDAFGKGDPAALDKATRCIQRCHEVGIDPYVSFLAGNPEDDEGTFDRMLEFARKTKIDLAEFCVSTPYPNTPFWHRYLKEDRIFDRTWKHYNDANVVFRPYKMSPERLQEGYLYLWREFYKGRETDLTQRDHTRRTIQF
ncbi:MAG: B12-binding domain-containing radical SAM protein [Deltaproteobacteria bacterium]|nr:B12-binding domain-containing radical SAM protein [Deltaproteobacteria bacterium]